MISTRSAGLLIDTVVCLTLAKWETVSGRFGGYLTFLWGTTSEKCEVAHTSPPIGPAKSVRTGTRTGTRTGHMAPKPKPARFEFTVGMVLAMALTILAVMTWVEAAPSSSLIYHPQLLLLY